MSIREPAKFLNKFSTALSRCQNADVLYVSIGSSKRPAQQLPPFLRDYAQKNTKKKVYVIAISPVWQDPGVYNTAPVNGSTYNPMSNVRMYYVQGFFKTQQDLHDNSIRSDEGLLLDFIREDKDRVVVLGDFLMSSPFPKEGISDDILSRLYRRFVRDDVRGQKKLYRTSLVRVTSLQGTTYKSSPGTAKWTH